MSKTRKGRKRGDFYLEEQSSKAYKKLLDKRISTVRTLQTQDKKVQEETEQTTQAVIIARMMQVEKAYERFNEIAQEIEDSYEYNETDIETSNDDVMEIYISAIATLSVFKKEVNQSSDAGVRKSCHFML